MSVLSGGDRRDGDAEGGDGPGNADDGGSGGQVDGNSYGFYCNSLRQRFATPAIGGCRRKKQQRFASWASLMMGIRMPGRQQASVSNLGVASGWHRNDGVHP